MLLCFIKYKTSTRCIQTSRSYEIAGKQAQQIPRLPIFFSQLFIIWVRIKPRVFSPP